MSVKEVKSISHIQILITCAWEMEQYSDHLEKSLSNVGQINLLHGRSYHANLKLMMISAADTCINCQAVVYADTCLGYQAEK